jgi:hypothetical protein
MVCLKSAQATFPKSSESLKKIARNITYKLSTHKLPCLKLPMRFVKSSDFSIFVKNWYNRSCTLLKTCHHTKLHVSTLNGARDSYWFWWYRREVGVKSPGMDWCPKICFPYWLSQKPAKNSLQYCCANWNGAHKKGLIERIAKKEKLWLRKEPKRRLSTM